MRAYWTMAALLPLALIACGPKDSDGDGLDDDLEAQIGTNPDSIDSDGDGIGDFTEYAEGNGTTDPTKADTDGDGFDDGVEMADGTDAADPMSYVRGDDGVWPTLNGLCTTDTAEGFNKGDRFMNLSGVDQFGQNVELNQFCGNVILIDYSAGWCPPCRGVAVTAEDEYRELADEGFLIVHMMTDDNTRDGAIQDAAFLGQWANEYDLTFPVVDSPDARTALQGLGSAGLYTGGIPFMMLVDQDMNIVDAATGGGAEQGLIATAKTLLAE
ncbi:MAG: redoxin family protein [Myxococcota bacterium]